MLKIMKNHALGFCKETDRPMYEFIVFDASKQTQTPIKRTSHNAILLADMFEMESISPIQAYREGLFEYAETESVNFPLPF